ncbi:hypothetical protein PROFUN_13507 [Planoprotostelium fungivorum]|uniref:Ubiquitin-like domain-containing protein n=1 Tax=Planoprotostelium fungivorum TaxID=1890364 RepID=A0A2P6N3X1_9EUKA|nr:hypothetical protein PROFUN_13507 [Planoprotostelium fungivorum]
MKNYERLENSATLGPHVFFKIYIRLRMDVSKYTDGDAALESPTWTSTVHRSPSRSDDHRSPATSSTPTFQAHSDADLFRLECSTPMGKRYNIWVTPTNTIAHVKLIIRGMTGMPTFNSALRVQLRFGEAQCTNTSKHEQRIHSPQPPGQFVPMTWSDQFWRFFRREVTRRCRTRSMEVLERDEASGAV